MMNDVNVVDDVEVIDQPEAVQEQAPDLGYLLNPARHEGESFEDYKVRRKSANAAVKNYLMAGRVIHNSKPDPERKGVTYVKEKQ